MKHDLGQETYVDRDTHSFAITVVPPWRQPGHVTNLAPFGPRWRSGFGTACLGVPNLYVGAIIR